MTPSTAVYAGYTEGLENLAFFNGVPQRAGAPVLPTGRQMFVKMSYLFRF